jgi:pilus assembly protein CpaB
MQKAESSRPRSVDLRVLVLALVLGAVAAGLIVAYLASRDSGGGEAAAVPTVSVVVASEDIAAGKKVTDSMVELKALPETAVISDAATAKEQVVGQTLRYPVAKGEQLSNLRLVEPPKTQSLSFQIPQGMRGFTVPVSVNNSPAALLAPGDFVDVLVSVDSDKLAVGQPPTPVASQGSSETPKAVVTLLQNVQVLSVQRDYVDNGVPYDPSVRGEPPKDDSVSYVTLSLTPEQAQTLWLASQDGAVTLALRAFGDGEIKTLGPVTEPLSVP